MNEKKKMDRNLVLKVLAGGIVLTAAVGGYLVGNGYARVKMARGLELCCIKHPDLYPKLEEAIKEVHLLFIKGQ